MLLTVPQVDHLVKNEINVCSLCPKDTFSIEKSRKVPCDVCAEGRSSKPESTKCSDCTPGKYVRDINNQEVCEVEEDRLRLFLLRLEQIGNVAYRSRQQQNNVQHHVLEMQAARRKVMETTWEHSSSDAQIMLASWRSKK